MANLIDRYGGNPLALKLVATATQDLFDGNIADVLAYLDRGIFVFEDIRHLLDRQFDLLSEAEQKTLFWFAIYREPVAIADICESVIGSVAEQSVPQQINSLIRRSLLEKTDGLFWLQPYVLACVTERLIQQICTEFETQQIDVLRTHSLIGVAEKDGSREILLRSIVQPAIERLLSRFSTISEIEEIANKLLEQQRQKPGYIAANLRDFLVQLQEIC